MTKPQARARSVEVTKDDQYDSIDEVAEFGQALVETYKDLQDIILAIHQCAAYKASVDFAQSDEFKAAVKIAETTSRAVPKE